MLSAVSNPIDVTSTEAAAPGPPSSPLSALFNSPVASSGQPAFAQAVHDAMNKTPTNESSPPNNSPTATESVAAAVPAQSPSSGTSAKGNSAKSSNASKQISQAAPQLTASSANNLANLSQLLPATALLAPPVSVPGAQMASTPTPADSKESMDGSSPLPNAVSQPLPSSLSDAAATHLIARLTQSSPSMAAIDFQSAVDTAISTVANTGGQTFTEPTTGGSSSDGSRPVDTASSSIDTATSNATPKPFAPQFTAAAANSDSLSSVFGPNFLFANVVPIESTKTQTPASSPTDKMAATTSATISATPAAAQQKANAPSQSSGASPNAQQSSPFSKIVDQIAALQSVASSNTTAPVVTTRLFPSSSQPSTDSHVTGTTVNDLTLPNSLSASVATTLSSAGAKETQPASIESHTVNPSQTPTSVANQHSSAQDSSSNQGDQSSSNSSGATPFSAAQLSPSKNQSTDFSAQLANATGPKPDVVSVAQTTTPSSFSIATAAPVPSQQLDSNSHSSQESLPSAPAQAQPTLPSVHVPDSPWGHQVSDAQLTNLNGQSEMRIAMQTDKLGAIELHARVSGDELGAAITVEKHDAHAALAIELPALQQSLSEKQLRVTQVALTQGSLSSTTGDAGASAQNNQRGTPQSPLPSPSASFWNDARNLSTAAWFVHEQVGVFNAQGRLSVQA